MIEPSRPATLARPFVPEIGLFGCGGWGRDGVARGGEARSGFATRGAGGLAIFGGRGSAPMLPDRDLLRGVIATGYTLQR
jgi:hypothetical protein